MLFINTLGQNREISSQDAVKAKMQTLGDRLIEKSHRINPESLEEEARGILFDAYMEESERVFAPSSMSRVFDYRRKVEKDYPSLLMQDSGKTLLLLLEAIDLVWNETQAPVSELVQAGKYQLQKVNGAATYANFSHNAKEMPDLFSATKALVDNYLTLEFYMTLIGDQLLKSESLSESYLEAARKELRTYAARGKAYGFWAGDAENKSELLKGLEVESYLVLI